MINFSCFKELMIKKVKSKLIAFMSQECIFNLNWEDATSR